MSLPETTRSFLEATFDVPESQTLLVGVSGGPDSMVLLDVLRSLQVDLNFRLIPLHVNYRFHDRSGEATSILREYCREYGLDLVAVELVDPDAHRRASEGLEARARKLRFEFFEEQVHRFEAAGVFLGHHRGDQVETILLNIGRGCGPGALAGMEERTERAELTLYRPFLSEPQEKLLEYAKRESLDYLIDPTNEDERFARNRLRHTLLPAWKQAQPAPAEAIANLSRRAARENSFWEDYLDEMLPDERWTEEIQVSRSTFRKQHPAVQYRYLKRMVEGLVGSLTGWDEGNLSDVRALFQGGRSGARLTLPGDVLALNEYDRGCLFTSEFDRHDEVTGPFDPPVQRNWLGAGTLEILGESPQESPDDDAGFGVRLDHRGLSDLRIRTWEQGDVLQTSSGPVRLKELFEELNVPFRARRYWPILLLDGTIQALPGLTEPGEKTGGVEVVFYPDHPTFHQLVKDSTV